MKRFFALLLCAAMLLSMGACRRDIPPAPTDPVGPTDATEPTAPPDPKAIVEAMGNTRIIAIYAIRDGQPVLIREGGYRARHYKLDDGTLYSEGSNGAAYSVFEAYGQCWFTWPKGDDQMEIGFYHAEDGTYDPAAAREITADEYEAKQIELAQKITAFDARNFG